MSTLSSAPLTTADFIARKKSKKDKPGSPTAPPQQKAFADEAVTEGFLWESTLAAVEGKADSADLAAVATSGSYNDLADKPAPGAGLAQAGQVWVAANGTNSTAAVGQPGAPFRTLNAALDAVAGLAYAVVWVGVGTFASPDPAKLRSHLRVLCAGQSAYDSTVTGSAYPAVTVTDPTALVGGTRWLGTFNILPTVKNFALFNCGIDCGSAYCATLSGSAALGMDGLLCAADPNHPDQNGLTLRTNMGFAGITVLLKEPNISFHGTLVEGCYEPVVDNVHTWGGFAGVVSKNVGGLFTRIQADKAHDMGIVLKQNAYATSRHTTLTNFVIRDGAGLALHNESGSGNLGAGDLLISTGRIINCTYGIKQLGTNLQRVLLSGIRIDATAGTGVEFTSLNNSRISDVHVNGAATGFNVVGAGTVVAGITSQGCSGRDVKVSSPDAAKPLYLHGAYCTSTGGIEYGDNCLHAANFAYAVSGTAAAPVENYAPPVVSDPSYLTPTGPALTGATYSAGTGNRTASYNATFDAGGVFTAISRAAGTAAKVGMPYGGAGSTSVGITLDERTVFVRVDQARYGLYVIAGSGHLAVHYQGDVGTDTGYVAQAGYEYFLAIGTDNVVHVLESSNRTDFASVYTFPGTWTGLLHPGFSLFNSNPLTGFVTQYIV